MCHIMGISIKVPDTEHRDYLISMHAHTLTFLNHKATVYLLIYKQILCCGITLIKTARKVSIHISSFYSFVLLTSLSYTSKRCKQCQHHSLRVVTSLLLIHKQNILILEIIRGLLLILRTHSSQTIECHKVCEDASRD